MATDWIKMRTDLYRDPKVSVIADELMDPEGRLARYVSQYCQCDMSVTRNVTRNAVVGALVAVWGVMRQRGKRRDDDLVCIGVTPHVLDDIADLPGFGSAMESAGWVIESPEGIEFPNFFEENNVDPSERKSASAAERQRRYRERQKSRISDDDSDVTRDVTVTPREEKRREEITTGEGKPSPAQRTKADTDLSAWHDKPTPQVFADWKAMRKAKRAPVSQTVIDKLTPEINAAVAQGYTADDCLSLCVLKGWQGFKFQWLKNEEANRGEHQRSAGPSKSERNTQAHRSYIADLEREAALESGECLAGVAEPSIGH